MSQKVEALKFEDDGKIPNNPHLSLVIYRDALPQSDNMTNDCRRLFERNGWVKSWVNGVFDYHHYHSTAHEVLAVTDGTAKIKFGGQQGEIVAVKAGDVVIIPAGVGHKRIDASSDFQVVGAYPRGQDWDLQTGTSEDHIIMLTTIYAVPLPEQDPVYGDKGYIIENWRKVATKDTSSK